MSRPLIAVLSLERTASQAVYHSLRALSDRFEVRHAHFLDGSPWRAPPGDDAERKRQAKKATKEARFRDSIANTQRRRVFFTVRREPRDRLLSAVWYRNAAALSAGEDLATSEPVQRTIREITDKEARYGELVFEAIGAPRNPSLGRHDLPNGAVLYVLDFAHLARDFATACLDAFGSELPLLRRNAGEERGDPGAYTKFKRDFQTMD